MILLQGTVHRKEPMDRRGRRIAMSYPRKEAIVALQTLRLYKKQQDGLFHD